MNYTLQDLIDIEQFQSLQDRLNEIYSFPSAIIDNDGNVLTATAWQDICTRFHRQHEECVEECIKSDQYILSHLDEANPAVSYRCPHGLVDNATPIIIDGRHLGNFFTGQFFLEPPDLEFFRKQAKRYGFDETAYLEAVRKVPIWTREQLNSYLFFIKGLIEVITSIGLKNLKEIETRQKLQESEARYRTVAEFTFDWEYWIAPNRHIAYCSPSCERICGYRAEEFEKNPELLIAIVHPEDRPRALQHMSELADPRYDSCEQEFRVVTRSGETRWIAHACTAVMDSDGVFRGRRGSNRDITDRKRAEERLRQSEADLNRAQKTAHVGSWKWHIQTDELEWSDEMYWIFGVAKEEFSGKLSGIIAQAIHPDDRAKVEKANRAVMELKTPIPIEYRVIWPDGSVRVVWGEAGELMLDEAGAPILLTGIVQDITQRKQTEENLRASEARLRSVIEAAPAILWVLDKEGIFLFSEGRALQELGLRSGDLVGRSAFEFNKNDEEMLSNIRRGLEGEEFAAEVETAGRHYRVQYVPQRGENGEVNGLVGISVDISEIKWAEEERERLEKQIQHAQKLESLGVLAGGIAHDFNNILMVILGNADLALQDLSPLAPARPLVEEVVTAARRASDLTRQMLAYSGKGRFIIQRLDLSEAVREMAHLLDASISKKARLKLDLGGALPAIEADTAQIQQVVMNLIINASEALDEERGGTITVTTGFRHFTETGLAASRLPEKPCAGDYVCIEVSDTGCGMSKETLENLFDPFYTTKFTGRGLGMSAVLGIVRGHKGAITVESTPGRGTIIRVCFPALDEPAPHFEADPALSGGLPHRIGMVLFVDDEPLARSLGKQMLERIGHTVFTAADGAEAVDLFEKHVRDIACVILDLSMPRMDGEQTFHRLRQIDKNCRVILASGYSEREIEERFAGQGIRAFLQKPYTLTILSEKLRSVLG